MKTLQFPKDYESQIEKARQNALDHNASNRIFETLQACKAEYLQAMTYNDDYVKTPASLNGCLFVALFRSSQRKFDYVSGYDFAKTRKNGNVLLAHAILSEKADAKKSAKIAERENLRKLHNLEVAKNKPATK